ncbi:hypothetical protein ACFE04_031641 [Oxalis oulophora]
MYNNQNQNQSEEGEGEGEEETSNFRWGLMSTRDGQTSKQNRYYKSFTLDGVNYTLYDCVYVYTFGSTETNIAKLVSIYQEPSPSHAKLVELVWFFRPKDVKDRLGEYQPRWNELFLASGKGQGVSDVNALESIVGKCNVVCTSKDLRNSQPFEEDLRLADYVFSRTFDVDKLKILRRFPDEIVEVPVTQYFNRKKQPKTIKPPFPKNIQDPTVKLRSLSELNVDRVIGHAKEDGVIESKLNTAVEAEEEHFPDTEETGELDNKLNHAKETKNPLVDFKLKSIRREDSLNEVDIRPPKKRKLSPKEKVEVLIERKEAKRPDKKAFQVEQRPKEDRKNWFKQLPWEEMLQTAHEEGRLVLLRNLNPLFASSEIKRLVRDAFKEEVDAKMIPQDYFSGLHCGDALVLFNTKAAAENAIYKLQTKSLILDGRIVVGSKAALKEPGKEINFAGHLKLETNKPFRERDQKRNTVAIAHASQPNTIEYEMAMRWREAQEKSDLSTKEEDARHYQQANQDANEQVINQLISQLPFGKRQILVFALYREKQHTTFTHFRQREK